MKKYIAIAVLAIASLVGAPAAQAAPNRLTVVKPVAPIVQQSGGCVDGVWVTENSVTLPEVENGRWLDPESSAGITPSKTFENLLPGVYTFGFTTAEGYYTVAEPRRKDTYYVKNGVAYYTVHILLNYQPCG